MRARLELVLVLFLARSLAGCGGDGGAPPDSAPPVDAAQDASGYVALAAMMEAELTEQGTYAAALAIVVGGEVTFTKGFGPRRPGDATPVSATTRFRIASLTKMMTAVAVLQQVQAGTLDLATPISTYLPGMHVAAGAGWLSSVTPRDLLTHGAGMTRAWDADGGCPGDASGLGCWVNSAGFATNVWLMAPPGEAWSYSNNGYRVLGALVETASQSPYQTYMHDRVFAPLGMTRTTFAPADVLADGDYSVADPLDWGVTRTAEPWRLPSGGAFSTVIDLSTFARFLMRGDEAVLPGALRAEMTDAQLDTDWTLDHEQYGYGLFVDDGLALADYRPYPFEVWLHDGLLPGYNSLLVVIPSREFAFVFLADGPFTFPIRTIEVALHDVLGLDPVAPLALTEDPADFVRYPGQYTYWTPAGGATVTITLDGTTLAASGALACALVPQKVGNFTCNDQWLTFVPGGDGHAEYLRSDSFVARRVP